MDYKKRIPYLTAGIKDKVIFHIRKNAKITPGGIRLKLKSH
jgi:hypothetical protein